MPERTWRASVDPCRRQGLFVHTLISLVSADMALSGLSALILVIVGGVVAVGGGNAEGLRVWITPTPPVIFFPLLISGQNMLNISDINYKVLIVKVYSSNDRFFNCI